MHLKIPPIRWQPQQKSQNSVNLRSWNGLTLWKHSFIQNLDFWSAKRMNRTGKISCIIAVSSIWRRIPYERFLRIKRWRNQFQAREAFINLSRRAGRKNYSSSDTGENVSAKTSRWHPVKSQTRQKIQAKGGHRHSHDEIFCKQKIDQSFYTLDVEKTLGWPNKYRWGFLPLTVKIVKCCHHARRG